MKLGLRIKFVGIVFLAAVVPQLIGLLALETFGFSYLVRDKGSMFAHSATHQAETLRLVIDGQIDSLNTLIGFGEIERGIGAVVAAEPGRSDAEWQALIAAAEAGWPSLDDRSPEVAAILENPVAKALRTYRFSHPLMAEVFVTDLRGRVVASTGKTSDYWQADEEWWTRARVLPAGQVWVSGLAFDESAGVFSLDLSMPVVSAETGVEGVMKAVVDVSPLLASKQEEAVSPQVVREVVLDDGRILARISGASVVPLEQRIPEATLRRILEGDARWMVGDLGTGEERMMGFARLDPATGDRIRGRADIARMFVLVHEPASAVLAPLRQELAWIVLLCSVAALGFAWIGIHLAGRKIIGPVETLGAAARAIAASARLEPAGRRGDGQPSAEQIQTLLLRTDGIRTGDEIQTLATDFGRMARQIQRYQGHLEGQIAAKTAEIQRDLDVAREFQEALLPNSHPRVPSSGLADPLGLRFYEIYRPTLTLGGDFFDLLKLSDHRAGVFIADVMGHGARSALVTAILRALIHSLADDAGDPARFLGRLNRQFHEVISRTRQSLFVTAFFVVADTERGTLAYASAGHPSPIRVNRFTGKAEALVPEQGDNPALGLFPDAGYTHFADTLREGDIVLLFTDGILEATNEAEEQFGRARLERVIRANLQRDIDAIAHAIVDAAREFASAEGMSDDLCLVVMEAGRHTAGATVPPLPVNVALGR